MTSPRVTVVVGAGGALGRAVVARLLAPSTTVVAVDRHLEALDALPSAVPREVADVTDAHDVESLFDRIASTQGDPAVVVHAVGGFRPGEAADATAEDYRAMLDLNLNSAWWVSRAAAARMRRAGHGTIVLVAARNGLEAIAGAAAYSVSKAAVVHLTRVLDAELQASGVRVNAIVPRLIDTPANRAAMPEAVMARAVSPEAIAEVIAFLVSDQAAPVVGAVIPVYGAG